VSAPKRKRKHRAPKKAKTRRDPEAAPSTPSDEPAPEPGNGVALPPRTLLPHHLKQLQNGSSISTKVIAQRGYWSATDAKELIKFGFAHYQRKVPALVVPVTGVNGEVVTWVLRPDSPRVSKGKLLKYETPKDSRVVIDVPKAILSDIGDPSVRLWITEGSKKADSAVSRGICCIALFGVWNWRGSNEDGGKTVLPDWESVALRERSVVIAFDSDVATNPNVQMALTRLRAFLKSRGARVKVCLLPPGPDGAKTGLDDFFVRGGTVDQLEALVVDDLPKESAALEQRGPYVLKEDGVYLEIVNDAGSVAVLKVTNFVPRITEEIRRDDGVEQTIHFRIEVEIAGQTRTLVVNAEDFREHVWIHGQVGADAIVEVGHSGQRISHMVQTLSRPKRRTVYAHTGWRLVGGKWHFLHVDGALGPLGPLGPLQGTGTDLPEALRNYSLPPAPTGDERTRCVRASLSFLDVAPIRVSAPLLLLAYRAVLGQAGISGFLLGFTGTRKSSTAAVLQQHFGPGFSLTTLPGSWTSTANALEESLFAAKDVLFVLTRRPTVSFATRPTGLVDSACVRTARCDLPVRRARSCWQPARFCRAATACSRASSSSNSAPATSTCSASPDCRNSAPMARWPRPCQRS
jgi:hypothetical protein